MTFSFRPAKSFTDRHGVFVSLTGGTNSGKSFSALRLARGIAGPAGKVAVLDTEGGRTLHLKDQFDFDADLLDPPFRPHLFAEAAKAAEDARYDALVIDSFSMSWVGIGGVLDWHDEELQGAVERAKQRNDRRSEFQIREASKFAAWIKPKGEYKAMVYSLLQRRIPIIFAIRGEETVKPGAPGEQPVKVFRAICAPTFPFEVTVSFRLDSDRKGFINLSDPKSWKMEEAHQAIFRDGEQISEEHGASLARWACGAAVTLSTSETKQPRMKIAEWLAKQAGLFEACETAGAVDAVIAGSDIEAVRSKLQGAALIQLDAMIAAARTRVTPPENDGGNHASQGEQQ